MTGGYSIRITRSAQKEINALSKAECIKVVRKIEGLATDPRPEGCRKLSDREAYRIRQGTFRIIYTIEDDVLTVQVIRVAHRREAYR